MHIKRHRLPGEIVFDLLLIVFSLFMLYTAYGISGFESTTSAGAFPLATTFVMVVSGLIILFHELRAKMEPGEPGESLVAHFFRKLTPPLVVAFAAAAVAYMLLLERLGFVLASYLFLLVSMWVLGSRRLFFNLWVSAVSLGAIYFVFQTVFSVSMPIGTWLQGVLK